MGTITEWLNALGLSEYAQRFAENDIELDILPELTDRHLKDLGVSLGHRLKMLRAIRELGRDGATVREDRRGAASPSHRHAPQDAAERRQLTVLFCDLVGSTALSTRLDPEDMRNVIRIYQEECSRPISRYEGTIGKFMGDGILAYFGFRRAHEDDAECAVRAGLDMVAAVARLKAPSGEPLQARVGIATGLVVVGDLIGEGAAQEQAVLKIVGVVEPLRECLEPFSDRIKVAFVFGSVAKGTDTAQSDIDVIVIGDDLNYSDLYTAFGNAEARLRRKVNAIFLSPADWRRKASEKRSFFNKIVAQPKLLIVGSDRDI